MMLIALKLPHGRCVDVAGTVKCMRMFNLKQWLCLCSLL